MSILRVYVGLDYHTDSIRVCILDQEGEPLVNRDVENDPGAVRDLVTQYGYPLGVALEACCGAADFAAELHRQTEWSVRLAHAGYVQRLKQGPDKSDHDDAWVLADLLRVKYLPEVWLADETTRQLRRLVRYRQGLVTERKNIKLRILGLLREERRVCPDGKRAWTESWFAWVKSIEVGSESRWVLDRELRRLERIETDIHEAESRMEESTAADETTKRLREQPGIGLVTAVTFRAEIGRFDRFRSGKQLAKYCGLTPCNASSGKRQGDAGLIRTGNKALRALIIQAAQRLPRHEEKWGKLKQRLVKTKPACVATAAVGNRWLRWLYHQMQPSGWRQSERAPVPMAT